MFDPNSQFWKIIASFLCFLHPPTGMLMISYFNTNWVYLGSLHVMRHKNWTQAPHHCQNMHEGAKGGGKRKEDTRWEMRNDLQYVSFPIWVQQWQQWQQQQLVPCPHSFRHDSDSNGTTSSLLSSSMVVAAAAATVLPSSSTAAMARI